MAGAWTGRGLGSRKRCGLEYRAKVDLETAEDAAAAAAGVRAREQRSVVEAGRARSWKLLLLLRVRGMDVRGSGYG